MQNLLPPNSCPKCSWSRFWLFQPDVCALCLLLAALQATPDLGTLDLTILDLITKGNRECVGKCQMTGPASHQGERSEDLQDVVLGMLATGGENALPLSLPAVPLPLFSCCVCLESGSLYSFKAGSKENTQVIFARNSGFSISTSLTSLIFPVNPLIFERME